MSQSGITPLFTGIGVLVVVIICSSCSSSYFSSNVVSSPSPSPALAPAYSMSSTSPSPDPIIPVPSGNYGAPDLIVTIDNTSKTFTITRISTNITSVYYFINTNDNTITLASLPVRGKPFFDGFINKIFSYTNNSLISDNLSFTKQ